jgi:hypothetical protein
VAPSANRSENADRNHSAPLKTGKTSSLFSRVLLSLFSSLRRSDRNCLLPALHNTAPWHPYLNAAYLFFRGASRFSRGLPAAFAISFWPPQNFSPSPQGYTLTGGWIENPLGLTASARRKRFEMVKNGLGNRRQISVKYIWVSHTSLSLQRRQSAEESARSSAKSIPDGQSCRIHRRTCPMKGAKLVCRRSRRAFQRNCYFGSYFAAECLTNAI